MSDEWLVGPIGEIGENADQFVDRLIKTRDLHIKTDLSGVGLIERMDEWGVAVRPEIEKFYLATSKYDLKVKAAWRPIFGTLGYFVGALFSRRIRQLNLPQGHNDVPKRLTNEIILLLDKGDRRDTTIWKRSLADSGEIVFFGIYTTCQIPSGDSCVKAIFPLPRGSATVLFKPQRDEQGNLVLVSSGKTYGDPGFYFLVEDCKGCLWKHYLPSFRETIFLSGNDDDDHLIAKHSLTLWAMKVYEMVYRIDKFSEKPEG